MTSTTTTTAPFTASRRGDIHRWSRTLIPTAREAPADAEIPSHKLLTRAGAIRKLAAGVYDYLPLALRSLRKIETIIRDDLDAAGATEFLMPALEPVELLKETGRDEAYGDDLFRLQDRHGRGMALAPTHEEPIVEMMRAAITSYKQLPLNLYQIQTKFRDEPRPRSGLLRGREFIMKDAYSFHLTVDGPGGLNDGYDAMYRAYSNIFTRCGLDFTVVEAESGPIGGSASHEFMVNAATGEDKVLRCPISGYAANVEKAEIGERPWSFDGAPREPLEKVHTPGMADIASVADFLKLKPAQMLKTIVFRAADDAPVDWILAIVRGDHDVNEGKVRDAAGCDVALADEKQARAAGFAIGYISPRAFAAGAVNGRALLLVDPDAAQGATDWATGADAPDHHIRHFNWIRDIGADLADHAHIKVADIRNAEEGDPSPRAEGARLITQRGIEVGHIFKLGTKYSDAMGFTVLDSQQKRCSVIMGCYGIGVSRTMAACVEMSHDDKGIIWPAAVAPYHIHIVLMKPDEPEHMRIAENIASDLAAAGADVLIDDRKERPGVKFNDADLIGMPIRITIGAKALEQGGGEYTPRADQSAGGIVQLSDIVDRCLHQLGAAG
ncbi:MAG: proline--tRNA ligase [Phycisphaerales bacterium JB039]